ncbi:extracellular solute-binding protein family 1 [Paenibacillus algicola]|uniref:Extracellular solute-binding protein family 1 n=1 Tax=Paenibacillus algicola TaxID=2565926 RepID=A0A4P8XHC1_9BACL|nr:extracellular solute-binding protein [Paenibacillus algicola]QCT01563.1 extracellular solute-binding protein family 1 [Paenibacillus algicola]
MKKWMSVLLVGTLSLSLAACGSSNNSETDTANNNTSQNEGSTGFENGKYDPPITLTTVQGLDSNASIFKQGETMENNVHTELIKDRLGIELKYDWVVTNTNDAYKTKLRLMLSSGEKMPDVVRYRGDMETVNMLIDSGQFMAVDELVEQYAGEEYKKGLELDPTIWYPVTRDGKKMALPILDYAYNSNQTLFIREDWLKKLNLKAPTTLEEMEQVMDAFVNQDPDGNGKKDTIGLAAGFKNGFNNWMTDIGFVFGAHGVIPGSWNPDENGKLSMGSVDPAAKEALATIQSWMEKGYISQDAALKDEVGASEFFTKGQAGMMVGPNWIPAWPLPDFEKNVPDGEYKAYPLPAGPTGKAGAAGNNPPVNGYLFINKDAKNPEAVLHYYNFFFDNFANPAEGSEFAQGFAEGYDYAVGPDGKVIKTTEEAKANPELFPGVDLNNPLPNPMFYTLTYEGARIPTLYAESMVKAAEGGELETPYEKTEVGGRHPENVQAMKVIMDQQDIYLKNYYMGPLTETMQSKNELLNKLINEAYNKIVYGQVSVDEFDKMVENWKKSGGEQITEEVNAWYDTVK